eukprot:1833532-Rhodomonas_salina.1
MQPPASQTEQTEQTAQTAPTAQIAQIAQTLQTCVCVGRWEKGRKGGREERTELLSGQSTSTDRIGLTAQTFQRCVCVCDREREKEGQREGQPERDGRTEGQGTQLLLGGRTKPVNWTKQPKPPDIDTDTDTDTDNHTDTETTIMGICWAHTGHRLGRNAAVMETREWEGKSLEQLEVGDNR